MMKTFREWADQRVLEECIGSAASALGDKGISFKRTGNKLVVSEDDLAKAKSAVKSGSSSPDDVNSLQSNNIVHMNMERKLLNLTKEEKS